MGYYPEDVVMRLATIVLRSLDDLVRLLPVDAEAIVARLRIALGRIERPYGSVSGTATATAAGAGSATASGFAKTLPQRAGPKPAHFERFLRLDDCTTFLRCCFLFFLLSTTTHFFNESVFAIRIASVGGPTF